MLDFDPLTFDLQAVPEGYLADPYGTLAALRDVAPVHRNPDGTYVLTRHADLVEVYRNPTVWQPE